MSESNKATHKHVVLFSGGTASAAAAVRVRNEIGDELPLFLLFTDTKSEDEDLYRFLEDASKAVNGTLVTVSHGLNIWELFHKEGLIGNSRMDVCSRKLKREPSRKWLHANCDPEHTTIYVGYGVEEPERFVRFSEAMEADGWTVDAPMLRKPWQSKAMRQRDLINLGLTLPRMYAEGFDHNNCGAFSCVKGGIAYHANILRTRPDAFARAECEEGKFRERRAERWDEGSASYTKWWDLMMEHGGDEGAAKAAYSNCTILKTRRMGVSRPLPLRELRERIEQDAARQPDLFGRLITPGESHVQRDVPEGLFDPAPGQECSCFSDVLTPVVDEQAKVTRLMDSMK